MSINAPQSILLEAGCGLALRLISQGPYNGWVVAVNPGDLTKQLYQPMVSLASSQDSRVDAKGNKILAANM